MGSRSCSICVYWFFSKASCYFSCCTYIIAKSLVSQISILLSHQCVFLDKGVWWALFQHLWVGKPETVNELQNKVGKSVFWRVPIEFEWIDSLGEYPISQCWQMYCQYLIRTLNGDQSKVMFIFQDISYLMLCCSGEVPQCN